jgi:hypothetical protein
MHFVAGGEMELLWATLSALWAGAEKLGGLGQVVAAFITGYAISFAKRQIAASTRSQREATLRQLNIDQNRLSFENPTFAWPELLKNVDHTAATIDGNAVEYRRYHQFVIIGLVMCERAAVDGRPGEWSSSIDEFLRTHKPFLAAQPQDYFWQDFDERLKSRWRRIMVDPAIATPAQAQSALGPG